MLRGTYWHNLNKFLEGCHWMSQVSLWDYLILAHTSKWLILCLVLKSCEIYKRLTETPVVKLSHLAPPTLACHQISCINQSLGPAQIYLNSLRWFDSSISKKASWRGNTFLMGVCQQAMLDQLKICSKAPKRHMRMPASNVQRCGY